VWDKEAGQKVILCRTCHEEQVRLIPWGEEEWIGEPFVENMGLTITTVLGSKRVVSVIRGEGEEKKPKKAKRAKRFNRKKILKYGVAIPAAVLGSLQLILTAVAIQYRIFIWPFTLAWDAFMFMGPEAIVLLGMVVSPIAIGLGIVGAILLRRRR
jgi:hypothetical protein